MYNLLNNNYLAANQVIRYLNETNTYILDFRNIPETIVCIFEGSSNILFTNLKIKKPWRDIISSYSRDRSIRKQENN
jgi:predicted sulfurtransferase